MYIFLGNFALRVTHWILHRAVPSTLTKITDPDCHSYSNLLFCQLFFELCCLVSNLAGFFIVETADIFCSTQLVWRQFQTFSGIHCPLKHCQDPTVSSCLQDIYLHRPLQTGLPYPCELDMSLGTHMEQIQADWIATSRSGQPGKNPMP